MSRRGYTLAALAALMFSTMGVFGRLLLDFNIEPLALVTLRAIIASLTLFVVLLIFKRSWLSVQRRDISLFAVYGLVGIAAGFYLYFTALDLIGISLSVVLLYTYPVFVVILSRIFLGEKITLSKAVALLLTVVGVVFVAGIIPSGQTTVPFIGVITALLAAAAVATHSIFGKRAVGRYPTWTVLLYAFGFGALFLFAVSSLAGGAHSFSQPLDFWVLLAALTWISTLGANLAYIGSLRYIEAGQASITTSIEPVFAILLGYLFFQETLTGVQIIGTVSILSGIIIVQIRSA